MPTIKDLHCAMGEFLTASSEVENWMLSFVTTCQRDRARDEVFVDFMGKTLGQKIDEFRRVGNAYEFTKGQRPILDEAYAELDTLLPKRNFIVHGTTYYGIGKNSEPYRIGMRRGDFDRTNWSLAQLFDGPHAFTVERIAVVTAECVALREKLATVFLEVIEPLLNPRDRHTFLEMVEARRRAGRYPSDCR
jgi:hypothetical protein